MKSRLYNYLLLTKPTIMLLVLFSGATALFMEGSLVSQPLRFLLAMLALYLTGGSANALNNYFERHVDAQMARTKSKRPLPNGSITPHRALIFAVSIGLLGFAIFVIFFNWLSGLLSLGTILFYSLFSPLIPNPAPSQNIVIGGVAGAMAPVGMWAAATGSLDVTPWTLFLIIFFWSPPHFWALAIAFKEDYKKVSYPMLPLLKGDDKTLRQIFYYSIALFLISLTPVLTKSGIIYLICAVISGGLFIRKAALAQRYKSHKMIWGLFGFSIVYLFSLFAAIIIDSFMNYRL